MSVRHVASLVELQKFLQQPKLTVVDFFATWCGPCQKISPQLELLATQKPNVNFCKVDVDQAKDIMQAYPVTCMPTFRFFKNGQMIQSFEGADINSITSIVQNNETIPPPPIPAEEELQKMRPRDILALMSARHIDHTGLVEKSELIEKLNKFRS